MLNDVYCTSFRQMEVIDKNTPHSEFQISGTTLINYIAKKMIMTLYFHYEIACIRL